MSRRMVGVAIGCVLTGMSLLQVGCAVDSTPPSLPANLIQTTPGNDRTPTFTWDAASDEGSGVARYWVMVDDGDWIDVKKVTTYTRPRNLDEGSHFLRVAAEDKAGNRGEAAVLAFVCDTKAPVISNVAASISAPAAATIMWATDECSSSQVEYGKTVFYGSWSTVDPSLVVDHAVTLTGLAAGTYHFRVRSMDAGGNSVVSGDSTFTGCGTILPVIDRIATSKISTTSATITWATSESATSQVTYGQSTSYGSSSALSEALVTDHSVTLTGLASSTTYHYVVRSADACGREVASADQMFDTAWSGPNGETLHENVSFEGGTVAGADGHKILLDNNPEARDVTWAELRQFLQNDQTNALFYNDSTLVCADFAERLHNNAENAGIRAAYVVMDFKMECVAWSIYDSKYPGCSCCNLLGVGHACNAFMTTDRGLVFVDDTGRTDGTGEDCTVSIASGQLYVPQSIFSSTKWCPMGTVTDYGVTW